MRLHSIKLDNYIGIYNGMGLDSISIDFSRCTHKILVIKGDNGSGKSTIYRAMNPMNDSTSEFINGKDGRKEISYLLDDGSILKIRYVTQAYYDHRTQRYGYKPAKCSITRQFPNQIPIELNTSGNVTTGKEILYDLFKLDDNFLVLSALSATNKGIGMQRPAERKRYVNVIIDSLSEFIDIHKFLSKKGNILKSLMNSLTTKLSQIGNIEMVNAQVNQDTKSLADMDAKKTLLTESLAAMKVQLDEINKNGNVNEEYSKEVDKMTKLKKEYESIDLSIVYSEEDMIAKQKEEAAVSTKLSMMQDKIQDIVQEEQSIRNEITEIEVKLEGYDESQNEQDKLRYKKVCEDIVLYQSMFDKIGFHSYDNITEADYKKALYTIQSINSNIAKLHDTFDIGLIGKACSKIGKKIERENYDRIIASCDMKRKELQDRLQRDSELQLQAIDYENIPKDCNHIKDCPFIANIVKAQKNLLSDKEKDEILKKIKEFQELSLKYEKMKEEQEQLFSCYDAINDIVQNMRIGNDVLERFFGKPLFTKIEDCIGPITRDIGLTIDLDKYREYTNYISLLTGLKADKEVLEQAIRQHSSISGESRVYKNALNEKKEKLHKILDSKAKYLGEIKSLENLKNELNIAIQCLHTAKASQTLCEQISKDLGVSTEKVNSLREKVNLNTKLSREYQEQRQQYNQLTLNDIPLVSNRLEKAKYQLVLFDQYKKDYEQYDGMYKKLQTLLFHSSPKGIQSIYIEAFMNSMLTLTNRLLQLLFNGRFMIKEFCVKENEFSIPCIDANGNPRDDIAEMSDSQLSMISMIISFVILHNASEYYNIIKLDEVDGNLDNTNRLQFAVLINQIIDILNFHQCIIISHNNEIDLSQADIMIFRIEKREELQYLINSGGNIIFNYNGG